MGSLTNYTENKLLDHVLKTASYSAPATVYCGWTTTDPGETGSTTGEPSTGSYARQPVTFAAPASRAISSNADVTFPTATASLGTAAYFIICDAASGGNVLAYGTLNPTKNVASGKALKIPSGQITITATTGGQSNYLAHALLNHTFRNTPYTVPTNLYVLLTEVAIVDTDTGSTVDELDMTNYARELHNNWDAAASGASENTGTINFGELTGTGETVEGFGLSDSGTIAAGNLLFYSNDPSQTIDTGDYVEFEDGAFDVTMN